MAVMTRQEQEAFYGKDAQEWLARWDRGETVWSIKMGGDMGPGYEQAIQIATAEWLRMIIDHNYDGETWKDKVIGKLGLSGAQAGAAIYLAARLYKEGPPAVFSTEQVKDRHIQVERSFPS